MGRGLHHHHHADLRAGCLFHLPQQRDRGCGITLKNGLTRIAITYGVFQLLQAGFVFIFIYLAGVLGERVSMICAKMLFNHLQDLSLSYYAKRGRKPDRPSHPIRACLELLTWGVVDTTWAIMNIRPR